MTPDTRSPRTRARPSVRRLTRLVIGIALVGMLAACGRAEPVAGDVRPGAAEGDAIEVVMLDNVFEPAVLEIEAGREVTIEVRNAGDRDHNLVIEDLDLSTGTMEPGEVVTATFAAPDGPVTFVCTFHRGQVGEIRLATS